MWNSSILDGPLPVVATYTDAVDQFGKPYKAPATWRPEYHLNTPASMLTPELKPFAVSPANPQRVFAVGPGEDYRSGTAFLVFKDEAEARSVLARHFTPLKDAQGGTIADPPVFKTPVTLATTRIDAQGKRNAELIALQAKVATADAQADAEPA